MDNLVIMILNVVLKNVGLVESVVILAQFVVIQILNVTHNSNV